MRPFTQTRIERVAIRRASRRRDAKHGLGMCQFHEARFVHVLARRVPPG
jgi:hypothetical protein